MGGYLYSIPNQVKSIWHDWTSSSQVIWGYILIPGFLLSLILHKKISKVRFPTQVAAVLWIVCLVFIQRPEQAPKAWVYLQAPVVMWSSAGLMGLFNLVPARFSNGYRLKHIVVSCAALVILVNAFNLGSTIPQRWQEKGPVEKTIIAIQSEINPSDLIVIDPPYDAIAWYYSDIYLPPYRYFNKNLPFDRLFVIVASGDGQSLKSVLESRGPDLSQIDLENSSVFFSSGSLATYLIPHR